MSEFTISGTSTSSTLQQGVPTHSALEDRLLGLTEDELRQLIDMVTCRLSKRSLTRMKAIPDTTDATDATKLQQLTARESEVLTLVASGYTRPEVAKALKISRNTAATHVANIYRKLEIESIAEATMLAFRWGIVT